MTKCVGCLTGGRQQAKWDAQGAAMLALPALVVPPGAMGFRLQGSPVGVNRAYTLGRGRRAITLNALARDWKRHVALAALAARPSGWPLDGQYELDVHSVFTSPLADRDGPLKLVQDALQGVAYASDRQVLGGRTTKGPPDGAPRLEVIVRRLGG